MTLSIFFHVLIKGTASEVFGIDSETVFRNTVSESRIVTSEKFVEKYLQHDFRIKKYKLWNS